MHPQNTSDEESTADQQAAANKQGRAAADMNLALSWSQGESEVDSIEEDIEKHILLTGDSRVQGVCDHLIKEMTMKNSQFYLDIKSYEQLGVDDIGDETYDFIESDPGRYSHVILMAGIYDIAQPVQGTPYLNYYHKDPASCASEITAKFQFWIHELQQIAPRMKVIVASTFGANIDMYNACSQTEEMPPRITRQSELNKSVIKLNGDISVLNGAYKVPNLHLNYPVHTNRSKWKKGSDNKVSNRYHKLYDGLHPDVALYEDLAKKIHSFMENCL